MKSLSIACLAAAACAGTQSNTPSLHRQSAPERAAVAASYTCGDTVLEDQVTSGGQRLVYWQPCWDWEMEPEMLERRESTQVVPLQTPDRRLVEAEAMACANVGPSERERSPFSHRKQIAQVTPHRVAGRLAGVRVRFERVPGLTADFMRKDIECHRARWETLGRVSVPTTDPTLIDGARVTVFDRNGQVEVLVETDAPDRAELALARAKGEMLPLPDSQSALR
ncbi:MAG: hypothetical protein JWO36_2209 [Myxococcales bacterium]|nr:hypothetical protein [Myxococcales bacterium]